MNYNGVKYNIDESLSFKDFSNRDVSEYDFSGKIIYASSFLNERPDSEIFGSVIGATFIKCNMDNVVIPEGVTVIDCSNRRFQVQNDLNDWIIDEGDNPISSMLGEKIFSKLGLPLPDPADIPDEPVEERIDLVEQAKAKLEGIE